MSDRKKNNRLPLSSARILWIVPLIALLVGESVTPTQGLANPVTIALNSAPVNAALDNENDGVVRLRDGTVFKGTFRALTKGANSPQLSQSVAPPVDGTFQWICPSFSQPLFIPWEQIDSIAVSQYEPHSEQKSADNSIELGQVSPSFVFEYWDGRCLTGQIQSITAENVAVTSDRFSVQTIPLSTLRSILRVQHGETKDAGVLAPAGWKQSIPPLRPDGMSVWSLQVDSLKTQTAGAQITYPVFVPEVCSIEIDTAWNHSNPNWMLTVGAPRQLQLHLRKIEHRNALSITLLFEEKQNADISTAIVPFDGLESIKLRILADYIRGRFALELAGKTIAEIRGKEKTRSGGLQPLSFTNNTTGGVSLKNVRVSRSVFSLEGTDAELQSGIGEPPKLILDNSEEYVGFPADFREADQSFGFAGSASVLGRIALKDVERIELHAESQSALEAMRSVAKDRIDYAVELKEGGCITASQLELDGASVVLSGTPIAHPIRCELADVDAIRIRNASLPAKNAPESVGETRMRLVTEHAMSRGVLANHEQVQSDYPGTVGGLFWKSDQLKRVAGLADDLDGVIDVFHAAKDADGKLVGGGTVASNSKPQTTVRGGGRGPDTLTSLEPSGRFLLPGEPSLYLAAGDAIPGKISSISGSDIRGTSEYFGEFQISSEALLGYRLLVYSGTQSMDPKVVKRLLTLPRLQRDAPPKNLIVSREGDILRGTLSQYDGDRLTLSIRGHEQSVDTKNIAEIIWLDAAAESAVSESTSNQSSGTDVHVLLAQGASVRMSPDKILDAQLLGSHALLGSCVLPFSDCRQILLGSKIGENLLSSRFSQWKLQHAIDPRFVQRAEEKKALAAGKSKWIGQKSPAWELDVLDKDPLQSTTLEGKVHVINFWNSGAEASLNWLPELASIVADCKTDEVRLITVNNMETIQVIRGAIAGMDLRALHPEATIGFDRDGSIARSFEMLSMPYTVVVGRDGKIQHVQLGYDEQSVSQMRDAISAALHGLPE